MQKVDKRHYNKCGCCLLREFGLPLKVRMSNAMQEIHSITWKALQQEVLTTRGSVQHIAAEQSILQLRRAYLMHRVDHLVRSRVLHG